MFLLRNTKSPLIIAMAIVSLLCMELPALCQIQLKAIGTYESGIYDSSAAEIIAHDPRTQRLFVVNAAIGQIDVLDIHNPNDPTRLFQIDISPYGAAANSVAEHEGILAVAVEADPKQSPGSVAFFNTDGSFLRIVSIGALPDLVTFTPNGRYVLVANEGEPKDYCRSGESSDPEGSVSVIDTSRGVLGLTQADVRTADFRRFTRDSLHPDILLNDNPNLQMPILGLIRLRSNGLDPSNKDGGINIAHWPVRGLYQPDAIAHFQSVGQTFLITANERDARDYECYSEESRVADLALNSKVFLDSEFFNPRKILDP